MIVDNIENNLFNYRFPEEEGFLYGFNLYALINGNDVLLIDSAFRSQVRQVKKDLTSKGLRLTHVLLTHFHPDHVAGLMVIPSEQINIGIDVAVGKNDWGVYFRIGEVYK